MVRDWRRCGYSAQDIQIGIAQRLFDMDDIIQSSVSFPQAFLGISQSEPYPLIPAFMR